MAMGSSERERHAQWWGEVPDPELVAGLRAGHLEAFDEFMRRFQRLVDLQARQLGVPVPERLHWVAELLHDVALTLARSRIPTRVSLAAYLIGACAKRARGTARASRLRAVHERASLSDVAATGERAVTGLCSEASLRDARGPGWEPVVLSPPLKQLVSALDERLTPDERQLLSWRGQLVPYSQMAQWLGMSRGAVKARVRRLVRRLVDVSLCFGATLDLKDRREFLRFLRRTEVVDRKDLRYLGTAESSGISARPGLTSPAEVEGTARHTDAPRVAR